MTYVVSRQDQNQRCDNRPVPVADPEILELDLESVAIRVELDTPLNDLFEVIRQAVSELENQGEKSNRIAEQLLAGIAGFCKATGCL